MKKHLTRIAPLRAGIVLAVFYGIVSLIILPFLFLTALFGAHGFPLGAVLVVFIPVLYAAVGFIGGIIGAAVYNWVASWTGGLEFEIADAAPATV